MNLSCPSCGASISLDALLGHEGAREAVMVALALPAPIGKLLVQYLGLFRPASRQLSFDRVARLLGELLTMIQEARIEHGGRIYSAPQDYWKLELEEMLAKRHALTRPLKTHGYLLTIIAGYSSKDESTREATIENTRAGRTGTGAPAMKSVDEVLGPADAKPRTEMPESVKKYIKSKGSSHA